MLDSLKRLIWAGPKELTSMSARFRLWLAVVEDLVIEREIETLRIRQSDFAEQHHSHLLVLCVVCIRFQT